ncbi:MAG: hypothetical protein LBS54_01110 [Dysgonamonadaceae bacterium]|jgi:hypothetical protein|nr:hypothetical protein [Dysgonamonadaceae bacterium]
MKRNLKSNLKSNLAVFYIFTFCLAVSAPKLQAATPTPPDSLDYIVTYEGERLSFRELMKLGNVQLFRMHADLSDDDWSHAPQSFKELIDYHKQYHIGKLNNMTDEVNESARYVEVFSGKDLNARNLKWKDDETFLKLTENLSSEVARTEFTRSHEKKTETYTIFFEDSSKLIFITRGGFCYYKGDDTYTLHAALSLSNQLYYEFHRVIPGQDRPKVTYSSFCGGFYRILKNEDGSVSFQRAQESKEQAYLSWVCARSRCFKDSLTVKDTKLDYYAYSFNPKTIKYGTKVSSLDLQFFNKGTVTTNALGTYYTLTTSHWRVHTLRNFGIDYLTLSILNGEVIQIETIYSE